MNDSELRRTVTDPSLLASAIAQMKRRLQAGAPDAQGPSDPGADPLAAYVDAHTNWGLTLEELDVAREELVAQNERLVDVTFELAEQRRRYSQLFALAPLPMIVTDARESIAELNDAAVDLFGRGEDAMLGKPWLRQVAESDRDKVREILQTPWEPNERRRRVEVMLHASDPGATRSVALQVAPLGRTGNPASMVWVVEDLRARHEARQLADRDRSNHEFLATVGHELRGPLSAMQVSLEILQDRCANQPDAAEALDVLSAQFRQVTRVVDDIVDRRSGVDNTKELRREPVDLRIAVRSSVASIREHARRRRQSLTVQLPSDELVADVDPVRIGQVLLNLLENASKYTPDHGAIAVRAMLDDDGVVITIRDSGLGIPPERLSTMFSKFVQGAPVPDRPRSGLGIGLPLAKELVESHGGTIDVVSPAPGGRGGTQVDVRLPHAHAAAVPEAALPEPKSSSTDGGGLRILMVEDSLDLAELVGQLLRHNGHTVEHAENGSAALRICERFTPQLVICDVGLPGALDGYRVASELRRLNPEVRIIAASGTAQRTEASQVFDAYLLKPYGVGEIEDLVHKLTREG